MTRRRYHTRCWTNGSSCKRHSKNVLATSPRDALAQVVDPTNFGPLHRRVQRSLRSDLIAYVKRPAGDDTVHGGIEVDEGWWTYR